MTPWVCGDDQLSSSPELSCRAGEAPSEIIHTFCREKWLDPSSCPQIVAEQVRRRFGFSELELDEPSPHSFSMPVTVLEPLCLVDWVRIGKSEVPIYHDFYDRLPEVAERFCADHHMPGPKCTETVLNMLQTQRSSAALAANSGVAAEGRVLEGAVVLSYSISHSLPNDPLLMPCHLRVTTF